MKNELYHHGILGMKWGIRRYQNPDGSLTLEGRRRYLKDAAIQAKKERKNSRKTFQSIAKQLLSLTPPKQVTNQILKLSPDLRREDVDVRLAMLQMQIYNALKGDAKAFELVRDTAGEKPSDNLHIESEAPIIQVSDSQIAMVIQQINNLAGD